MSQEDRPLFADNNFAREDKTETLCKPSVNVSDYSPLAFVSPETPQTSSAMLGVTKVSCFELCPPCFFTYYPLDILIMKRILGRNGSPQEYKRKQCNNNREVSTGLRFITVGGNKQILGVPLWRERIRKQLERIARWM